ncbi:MULTISPECIES: AraC family transcriptional regulator [Paenibacillus]|uniref:AraC family transcriptional regulator n=1 Tax=Paenibacillus TaxID=44249 RepID=UPI0004283E36|nr:MULTISPECIES: GyrI-like domain-containing protein [Paenibacillus]KGP78215.1 DNA gyrase inhibitor [Paenibacillus sp. MAEPY2]KGP84836.1 DNA gyrase inhibitor [Paenibacillus sp. MAEPY1]OZQ72870.1 DNA gyrase inhibitor [Paenibacillus taichungensis]HBU81894.1 DNA gyrase inhibitor [Paenibacillus sp.]
MEFHIENLPTSRIAYVREVGPYGPANSQTMETLKTWARSKDLLTETAILFGIPQDHPETTIPSQCRYDACIVISEDYCLGESTPQIEEAELPGGQYLVCKVKHTAEDVKQAWTEIFPYLESSGYTMANKPILERYTGDLLPLDVCEICVPVKL